MFRAVSRRPRSRTASPSSSVVCAPERAANMLGRVGGLQTDDLHREALRPLAQTGSCFRTTSAGNPRNHCRRTAGPSLIRAGSLASLPAVEPSRQSLPLPLESLTVWPEPSRFSRSFSPAVEICAWAVAAGPAPPARRNTRSNRESLRHPHREARPDDFEVAGVVVGAPDANPERVFGIATGQIQRPDRGVEPLIRRARRGQ